MNSILSIGHEHNELEKAKESDIRSVVRDTKDNVVLIDIYGEYDAFVESLGGTIVKGKEVLGYINNVLSSITEPNRYLDGEIDFIMALMKMQMLQGQSLTAEQKSKLYSALKDTVETGKRIEINLLTGICDTPWLINKYCCDEKTILPDQRVISLNLKESPKEIKEASIFLALRMFFDITVRNGANQEYTWLFSSIDDILRLSYANEYLCQLTKIMRKYWGKFSYYAHSLSETWSKAPSVICNSMNVLLYEQSPEEKEFAFTLLGH